MNFQRHSDTSREAYCSLTSEKKQLETVYDYILQAGNQGLTGREVANMMKLPIGTVSARFNTLIRHKRIKRSNITRKIDGRMSTVCFAIETTMGQICPESNQKRDRLRGLVKELLSLKNDDGTLNLNKLDVKRLEGMVYER